ncbi:MAG: Crp/Fnr family transcriptional regulator [Bacteroidia bacterium]|nr:Crp/Fnr family transcriptional regulator [Bacteroidia bacterium]
MSKTLHTICEEFFINTKLLSARALKSLQPLMLLKEFSKNTVFIKAGQTNSKEYVIVQGFCRSFLQNQDGNEISFAFYKSGEVLPPHLIRTRKEKALYHFQALTELQVIEFDAAAFLNLMIEDLEIRNFGNEVLKNELLKKTTKEIALATLSAKERLEEFRKEYALLENLIPHPIIASYLGITNVSLSRLRAERPSPLTGFDPRL